jgi:precorrin-6B methylase 2
MDNGVKYIAELSWAYRAARVLHIANRLDVFSILSGNAMTAEQLADKCNTKPETLEKLLIACAAMALVAKQEHSYANTEMAEKCLVKGAPLYQGDIIAHSATVWHYWDQLEEEICGVRSEDQAAAANHEHFIRGMANITAGGRGQLFIDAIDLSGCRKLFDVGGGPGCYSILACRKYPALNAVVFDMPETIRIAREMIAKEGMTDRISVIEGDWDKDDFGHDNDAILFSNVLHGPLSNAALKLNKACDSLASGGLLIVQEFLLNDEKTGPLVSALFNMMVGAYSYTELSHLITEAGFVNCDLVKVSEELGSSWVTARKA